MTKDRKIRRAFSDLNAVLDHEEDSKKYGSDFARLAKKVADRRVSDLVFDATLSVEENTWKSEVTRTA